MKTLTPNCVVRLATISDIDSIAEISEEMALSAKQRKTGIAVRTPEFLMDKVKNGLAMIAIHSQTQEWIGFCYLELWKNEKYVANSGLIISAKYRGHGFSRNIKAAIFSLCKKKFPNAVLFSLTSNIPVKLLNHELGFKEIAFSTILEDTHFVSGCDSWVDYLGLMADQTLSSQYVAMIHSPTDY